MTSPVHPSREKYEALHLDPTSDNRIRTLQGTPNHFQLFGLPVRLNLDTEALREAFLELSRLFHPDFHATADEATRAEVLRRSSLLNNAHKTLRELHKRAEYVVAQLGNNIESTKNAVPPELLEEMFDIQEAGEDLRAARLGIDEAALTAAETKIAPLRKGVLATRDNVLNTLAQQATQFDTLLDEGKDPFSPEVQAQLKTIRVTLDRLNYLRTVIRNLS